MCNAMVICRWGHNGRVHVYEKGFWNHVDAGIRQPLGRFTPNVVHWNRLGLPMYNIMVIFPWGHNGHVHGRDKGSWNSATTGPINLKLSWLDLADTNSATTGSIHSKSSSLEPPWSVMCHILVIWPSGLHGCNKRSWNLVHMAGETPVICLSISCFDKSI